MIIYLYTNKVNGKQYIGQTIREFRIRHQDHLRSNITYFDRALSKHGVENFEWEIIYEASDAEELNEKEIYFIQKYNTLKPNGYNVTIGGNSFNGYRHSDETKNKISSGIKSFYKENPGIYAGKENHNYGIKWSDEKKLKMSEIKNSFWDGNDEAKDKMSQIKKRFYKENPELLEIMSKRTKEWMSKNGATRKGIKHTEESKRKMSEAQKGKKMSDESRAKISENHARKRKVINLDTGEVFDTLQSASEYVGKSKSGISNTCRGAQESCGGYRWAYLDEHLNKSMKNTRKANNMDVLVGVMGEKGKR